MAKILPIITYPNKILREKSHEIKRFDKDLSGFVNDMKKTMLEKDGIGLAAPQVGKNTRLVIVNTKDGPLAMINPKITKKSWRKEIGEEGCLSVPNIYGKVKRHQKINVIYSDIDKNRIKIKAEGLFARVIQHEIDHIDGVLFIDYLRKKDLPEEMRK